MMKRLGWEVFSKKREFLMGFSIWLILVFHLCENYKLLKVLPGNSFLGNIAKNFIINPIVWIGACGVELFLFISGIGLYYSYTKNGDTVRFWSRNFKKIIIKYVIIAVPYLIWLDFFFTNRGLKGFLLDLSLSTSLLPVNRQCWYVTLIPLLYLLFPFLYRLRRYNIKLFMFVWFIFVVFPWVLQCTNVKLFNYTQVALTRIPIFILGVYCGKFAYNKEYIKYFPFVIICGVVLTKCLYQVQKIYGLRTTVMLRYEKTFVVLFLLMIIVWIIDNYRLKRIEQCMLFLAPYTLELYLVHVDIRRVFFKYHLYGLDLLTVSLYNLLIVVLSIPMAILAHKAASILLNKGLKRYEEIA